MKKGINFVLVFIFCVSFYGYPIFVLGQQKITPVPLIPPTPLTTQIIPRFMGGRVVSVPAFEIYALESTGFICPVMGKTLSIYPMGSPTGTPTSYYISSLVHSQTNTILRGMGQLIIARFSTPTFITCTHPAGAVTQIPLHTINLYGTSR